MHIHILLPLTKSQKTVDHHLINDIKLISNSRSLLMKKKIHYNFIFYHLLHHLRIHLGIFHCHRNIRSTTPGCKDEFRCRDLMSRSWGLRTVLGGKSGKIRKNGSETALEKTYFLHLLLQFWALKPDFLAISRQK